MRLAGGPEGDPGVCPADLQRHVVGEDVVAEVLQRRLRIGRGELSCLLHLLTDRHVDFLVGQKRPGLILTGQDTFNTPKMKIGEKAPPGGKF